MKCVAIVFVVFIAAVCADDCDRACSKEIKPQCAIFRKEFNNACEMNTESCKLFKDGYRRELSIEGECPSVCNNVCGDTWTPVCGSDGETYANQCALSNEICKTDTWIEVVSDGECFAMGGADQ